MAYLKQNKHISYIVQLFLFCSIVMLLSSCNKGKRPFEQNNKIMIKPLLHGGFFSENRDYHNQILALGENIPGDWEVFYVYYENDSLIKLKSSTGNFVSVTSDHKLTTGFEEEATFFLLHPHKQYYRVTTEKGESLFVDQNSMEVKVGTTAAPDILVIENFATLPVSWFSLWKLNWGRFFFQLSCFLLVIYFFFNRFKNLLRSNQLSYKTILVLGFILLFVIFDTKQWKDNKVIQSDAVVYYEYLPAAFIFKDLSFNFLNDLPEDFKGTIWVGDNEKTGRRCPKTTMGLAFMELPFFLAGHFLAKIFNYTAYGYSQPYYMMIALGCWVYVFLALFYLRKILLTHFSDKITSFTLITIVLATNLFYYTVISPGYTHAYSFCLMTLFVWQSMKWYVNKRLTTLIYLGLTLGLIALIRPTNVLIAVFFVLYGIYSVTDLKDRLLLFWDKKSQIIILVVFAFLVWAPQMAFWKYTTDSWLFFSYGEERFYFNNPHILDGLFSYRKGWLLYTPIMSFALVGIAFLYKYQKQFFWSLLIFTTLNIYVIYSWWSWYYGGSFSSRPMVDSYGLMAIPLAAFFTYLDEKTGVWRKALVTLIVLTTALNLFQTQQTKTCLHWSSMTKEAYWSNFFTLGWPPGIDDMLKNPDDEMLIQGLDERNN